MRDNQELFVIKIDLVSGILQIDSQITFTGLKRQILHLLPFLFLPDLMLLRLRRQRISGPRLYDITRLYLLPLLNRGRQIQSGLRLALWILRLNQYFIAYHQEFIDVFLIYG